MKNRNYRFLHHMPARKILLLLVALTFTQHVALAQRKYLPSAVLISATSAAIEAFPETDEKDSLRCLRYFQEGIQWLQAKGYPGAGLDSVYVSDNKLIGKIFVGPELKWTSLSSGNVDDELLPGNFPRKGFYQEPITPERLKSVNEHILTACENSGYPFATIRLDSIRTDGNDIRAQLRLDKGPQVRIDSIRMNGANVVAPVYLYNYLGVKPGALYDESQLKKIDIRLRELAFLQATRPSGLLFSDAYTRLDLFLAPKKASQFDGVIGLLPDETGKGKATLTGDVHLKLQNSFKRGEIIELNWRQLPPRSQDLKLHFRYPFLFNTPLGVDAFLNVYKRDTLFVDVIRNIGLLITLKGNNFVKAFVNAKSSNLQSTAGLEDITVLPPYADINTTGYGATAHWEELDYRLNPRKGFLMNINTVIGNRTITRNTGINPEAYENIPLESTQYQGLLEWQLFLPLAGNHVAAVSSQSAFIYSETIFDNELYRIGGLKSLRGFDEESIFASSYSMLNLEYRYLTDLNSFLFVFFNGAWYERNGSSSYVNDIPWGIGTGYNFQTKLGIMSISYALGKQFDNPIQIRNGKVHFGIVNYF